MKVESYYDSYFRSLLGIATEMSVWDGVVVSPHERAYIKTEKKEDGMDTSTATATSSEDK